MPIEVTPRDVIPTDLETTKTNIVNVWKRRTSDSLYDIWLLMPSSTDSMFVTGCISLVKEGMLDFEEKVVLSRKKTDRTTVTRTQLKDKILNTWKSNPNLSLNEVWYKLRVTIPDYTLACIELFNEGHLTIERVPKLALRGED